MYMCKIMDKMTKTVDNKSYFLNFIQKYKNVVY